MKKGRKKHSKLRYAVWLLFGLLALAAFIFMRFGGFSTGESADPEEFAAYAQRVGDIAIPKDARIIALGEATHGNAEFQELKLEVFKLMVEKYDVKAFALEGDFGGCEEVNRYIHGGQGTAQEAAAAIGFSIYRTEEMAELISFMRRYNESAPEGEDLRFYGFDMQRYFKSLCLLSEACRELGVDTGELQKLIDGGDWNEEFDYPAVAESLNQVKTGLRGRENSEQAIHFADMLLQYCELKTTEDADGGSMQRDRFMAENIKWIAEQEKESGRSRIFVSGHNMHVARWGSYDSMGRLLADEMGGGYYVIGTDFYKTNCNMPRGSSGGRTNQVFYSHDPLAKAAEQAGLDICWLDFEKASASPELAELISQYTYLGNLGEGYAWYMRLLPPSYRMFQPPAVLYDGMIFVAEAGPTEILSEE